MNARFPLLLVTGPTPRALARAGSGAVDPGIRPNPPQTGDPPEYLNLHANTYWEPGSGLTSLPHGLWLATHQTAVVFNPRWEPCLLQDATKCACLAPTLQVPGSGPLLGQRWEGEARQYPGVSWAPGEKESVSEDPSWGSDGRWDCT